MNKRHLRVIREIQDRIPKDLLSRLMKKEIQAPAIKKVYEVALTKPDSEINPKMKRRIRAVLDSGRLDIEVEVLDLEVEKQISDFVAKEIDVAVKLGRLPKEAPKLKLLNNKGKQYAKRNAARIRREFNGSDSDVVLPSPDDTKDEEEHPSREGDGSALHAGSVAEEDKGGTRTD